MTSVKREEAAEAELCNCNLADEIKQGGEVIRQGGIVAIPTETYYGLAVNPFDREAVSRLFSLKKRSTAKPLLTLIADKADLSKLTSEIPSLYFPLFDFWPGPLTLIFKASKALSPLVTGQTGTVGARISSHPLAQKFVSAVGIPITATSANISGEPAAVTANEVYHAFGSKIDFVLNGGKTPGGKGSTLIGVRQGHLVLVREGVIPFKEVLEKLGQSQNR